jgi:hypothetical protein
MWDFLATIAIIIVYWNFEENVFILKLKALRFLDELKQSLNK